MNRGGREAEPIPLHEAEVLWDSAAERAVLGAVLLDNTTFILAARIIAAEDFYHLPHQLIWQAFVDLQGRGEPLDVVTVGRVLRAKRKTTEAGGSAYLLQLQNDTPAAVHVEHYATAVRDSALVRRVRDLCRQVQADCENPKALFEDGRLEVANRALGRMHEVVASLVRNTPEKGGPRGSGRFMDEVRAAFEVVSREDEELPPPSVYSWGFPTLDAKTQLSARDMNAVAGDPESGKSAFVKDAMAHWERQGWNPGLILVEDNLRHFLVRYVAEKTGLNGRIVRDVMDRKKDVSAAHRKLVLETLTRWLGGGRMWPNWYYFEGANLQVEQVLMEARRLVLQHGCQIVVIETASRIKLPAWRGVSEREKWNHVVDNLAGLGPDVGCAVVPTIHLSRGYKKENRLPNMSDLVETGRWERHARSILICQKGIIILAKDNHGDTSQHVIHLHFDGPTTTWSDPAMKGDLFRGQVPPTSNESDDAF